MQKNERSVFLNALHMTTRAQAHAHLKARLQLPEWYGNNLDALSDCLGGIGKPTRIIIRRAPKLAKSLGEYGEKLVAVLQNAAEENPNIRIELRNGYFPARN